MWIKENQKVFHDKKYDNLKNILNVVLVNDLICCKGRIENANVPEENKAAYIIKSRLPRRINCTAVPRTKLSHWGKKCINRITIKILDSQRKEFREENT